MSVSLILKFQKDQNNLLVYLKKKKKEKEIIISNQITRLFYRKRW